MSELSPIPSDDKANINKVVSLVDEYQNFEIATIEDCEFAADVLTNMRKSCKALEDRRKEITAPMDAAKRSVMDLFKPASEALAKVEKILKPRIAEFHRKEQEAQRKREAEEQERARKAREKAEEKAQKLREEGKVEKAAAVEEKAFSTVAKKVAPTKVAGASVRKVWKAEVTDAQKLCAAIANGDIPITVLNFKQAELNKLASMYQNSKQFEGLNIYQDAVVATR